MRFSCADLAITGLPVGIVDLNCRGVEFEKKRLNPVFPFARTQYSEALVIEPKSRGVLDTPLSRSMTVFVRRKRAFAHLTAFESR
jgi:hypothetical protein